MGYNGGQADAFVVKLNTAGSGLVYATFLGGSSGDVGNGIAVDWAGNVYVSGYTYSNDFPTTPDAFDTSFNGGPDAFVVKLNPAGSGLVYATFLGGSDADCGLRHRRGRGGPRLCDGPYHLQQLPHHAGCLRHELQRRLGYLCGQVEPGRQRAGLCHLLGWQ